MLKLNNVCAGYGSIEVLDNVSIEVPEGKIVSILGANGAGKTTTLKTISGILEPSSGQITLEGERIDRLPAEKIVGEGIVQVPEGRQIFGELSVYENLKVGAYSRKNKKNIEADIKRMYDYFPILEERKEQTAGTLSGGEQQMLAIARGLMAEPKVLLLDEPSLGLAPLIVKDIFEIIEKINNDGTTILIVEQNANQALSIADYGYILETGKISFSGSSEALKNNDEVRKAYLGVS
ncbi:ABC transporter ATP-binding protein [Natroniella sp. ANB-PHB2]|uniref:ABC transporter ATP-binding protein n=1 Tax=Natroniella sp. ANB-PHB2 TaxID=3384444 RepID=UPI0038D3B3C4